jgi:hypothetical protein
MSNTILLKRSDVENSTPSSANLVPGELALNFADGNLFFKNSSNNIVLLASTQTLDIAGNITGGNLITAGITSTAILSVTGNADVGNLGTVGQVIATGNITGGNLSGTNITGTLSTAAQNNITSVGTLANLLVTGNVGVGTTTPAAKIEVNIAAADTALTAARLNLNSAASASETIPVTNPSLELRRGSMGRGTFVKFINQRPGFAGIGSTADEDNGHDLRFHTGDGTAHMFIDSAGTVSATGNVAAGNVTTAGLISATGNITGGNLRATVDIEIQNRGILYLNTTDNSQYIGLRSPATLTDNFIYTFPANYGVNNQVLTTNGAGSLRWEDPGGAGGATQFPNSTIQPVPSFDGNFDLSFNFAQTVQETPFAATTTDAFGVNLGEVYSMMDPVGEILAPVDLGVLT